MSLYNALFGVNESADLLLSALGITSNDVPRFRDCFVDESDRIVIYTRTGGGNREYYESEDSCREWYPSYFKDPADSPSGPWNSDLRKLDGYLYDEDDSFDSTYAYFYFSLPENLKNKILEVAKNPREKWDSLLKDLDSNSDTPETQNAKQVARRIADAIDRGNNIIEV